ncbi:MAG: lysylphosphatidylglycerol synthase transmembrane domain-containing protein [Planctomycetia bacterium]|nr:lysylphosphatidylglycerol synthase transmembrane domain-containing protein [Planctomycetia bacterium]
MNKKLKNIIIGTLKFLLIFGIFAFLFWRAAQNDTFTALLEQKKNWNFLLLGFSLNFFGILLTFIRWKWLVRGLGIPIGYPEAIRLGFLGLIFNLLPMGIVGGDLVKGYLLARNYPAKKIEAAASVIVDRIIGLYIMFLLGFIMIWICGFVNNSNREARIAVGAIIWFFILSTIGIGFLLFPESKAGLRRRIIKKIPFAGALLEKLTAAMQVYREHKILLLVSGSITFILHLCYGLSLYFLACGLFGYAPSILDHWVIYPISNTGTLIPLSAGPVEYFLDVLYPLFTIPGHEAYRPGFGMIVGVAFRFTSLLVMGIGGIYYLAGRGEIAESLKDFHQENDRQQD